MHPQLESVLAQLRVPGKFDVELPEYFNFGFDVIDYAAEHHDKTAFLALSAGQAGSAARRYGFSDLRRSSNRCANALRGLGLRRGEFVAVVLPRRPHWYDVMLGCAKAGIVTLPGTPLLTAADLEYRINKSGAVAAIVAAEQVKKIDAVRARCPSLRRLIVSGSAADASCGSDWLDLSALLDAADEEFSPDRRCRRDELLLAYFTSGTTAQPKFVPRDHEYALAHLITGAFWLDLRPEDLHWTLSDTGWSKAAWGMLFAPWLLGASMVLYEAEGFDPQRYLQLIGELGVTTFCAPPTAFRMFAQLELGGFDLSSIRHTVSAGEPLNPEAIRVWREATGTTIHDGYGQTETVNIVANRPGLPIKPGSMGKPAPGFDVQIVDEEGAVVADGALGQIALRLTEPPPPGLFDGYYEPDGRRDRSAFRHGWYYTGDTALRDRDGYIWFVGRADDVISSAGYRISPFEVESVLLRHPAVAESAVVGAPDPLRGHVVKAYVVLAAGYRPSEQLSEELQSFVKTATAPYKYPRQIEYRERLPKTVSGKIRRVELRGN